MVFSTEYLRIVLLQELSILTSKFSLQLQATQGKLLTLLKGQCGQMVVLQEPIATWGQLQENVVIMVFGVFLLFLNMDTVEQIDQGVDNERFSF